MRLHPQATRGRGAPAQQNSQRRRESGQKTAPAFIVLVAAPNHSHADRLLEPVKAGSVEKRWSQWLRVFTEQ